MKSKRFCALGFAILALLSLGLFLPVSFANAANSASGTAWPASYFAPFAYVMPGPSDDSKPSLIVDAAKQVGVKYFTLAFVIADGCKAVWGDMTGMGQLASGLDPGTPDPMMTAINQVRQVGGDVAISFGGANGPELAQACPDATSLQKQYQSAIDAYHVTHLDFDIEGSAVAEADSIDRRNKAIAALQQANPNLAVTYTLPVMPDGLDADGMNLLKNALSNHVNVNVVNGMTMDYGSSAPPDQMGANAISAAQAIEKQITSLGSKAKVGITPMIGANDVAPETTTLDDARKIANFVKQTPYVAETAMWSLGRDKSCGGNAGGGGVSPTCSGVAQQPYDFAKIFMGAAAVPPAQPAQPVPTVPQPSAQPTTVPQPSAQPTTVPQPSTQPAAAPQPSAPPPLISQPAPAIPQPKGGQAAPLIQPDLLFPCSDTPGAAGGPSQPSESIISQDWLSGDQGRFSNTSAEDTYDFPAVGTLFASMQGVAFLIIVPSIILLGYQIMLGALSPMRYASALEGLSRVILSGAAVAVSFLFVRMFINLENTVAGAIVLLHTEQPFPKTAVNGAPVLYTLTGEPAASYRGLVMPMTRWGCIIREFTGVFSPTLVTNIAINVPLIRSFVPFAGTVTKIPDLIHRTGEMAIVILSMLIWAQVFIRVLLLNYYILAAPLAFGSWGLPGEVGQNVVRLWFRGFLSVLFSQVVQLFVLTTLPLLLPIPQAPTDSSGIWPSLLAEFLPILTVSIVVMTPTFVGTSLAKALGTAGSMARAVVVAVGVSSASMGPKPKQDEVASPLH